MMKPDPSTPSLDRYWSLKEQVRVMARVLLLEEMRSAGEAMGWPWQAAFAENMWRLVFHQSDRQLDDEQQATLIRDLTSDAGGWWTWSDEHEEEVFVSHDEWLVHMAKMKEDT